jgi:hypothetical protein
MPFTFSDRTKLIDQVKEHALRHYNDGGWDVIVECKTDDELSELIEGATTLPEALGMLEPLIDVWADRQADAKNSAF